MKVNTPLVTIAIPTLNRADFLIKTVESALKQSYSNIEVVVVNNSSDDDTQTRLGEIKDARLKVFLQSRRVDMGENWNRCLKEASGEYFILVSDDDSLREDAIESLTAPFLDPEKTHKLGMVYSQITYIDRNDNYLGGSRLSPESQPSDCMVRSFLLGKLDCFPCATLFRTEDARYKIGGYDQGGFGWTFDSGMWIQIAYLYKEVAFIPIPLAGYRVHQSNNSVLVDLKSWVQGAKNLGEACIRFSEHREASKKCSILEKDVKKYVTRTVITNAFLYFRNGVAFKKIAHELINYRAYILNWYGIRKLVYQLGISMLPKPLLKALRAKIGRVRSKRL